VSCIILHRTLQYAGAYKYNTLQVVVYFTNDCCFDGDSKVNVGEGGAGVWDAHNISDFYTFCLGLNAAFYMCQI
jgi:hypothetical protein